MSRVTVEACIRLDVRDLARRGYLFRGWSGLWKWSSGPSVRLEVLDDAVRVSCRVDGEPLSYAITLTRTRCHYGGSRPWFHCPEPGCGRRSAVLFLPRRSFACRRCSGLAYQTQHESPDGRLLLKAQRIWERLGCEFGEEEPEKPKGMHWRTFERLTEAADMAYLESFHTGRMARMLAKADR